MDRVAVGRGVRSGDEAGQLARDQRVPVGGCYRGIMASCGWKGFAEFSRLRWERRRGVMMMVC